MSPQMLALGLTVDSLDDTHAKIRIPSWLPNRDEHGFVQASALLAAAEFASRVIWYRHLNPELVEMSLNGTQASFLKSTSHACFCSCELKEEDRESILRQINAGKTMKFDSETVTKDEKGQQISNQVFNWTLRPLRPVALSGGSHGG